MRLAAAALVFLISLCAALSSAGAAPSLRVRGGSNIRLVALDRGADVLIRGEVTDDVGATMGRVTLKIAVSGGPVVPATPCGVDQGLTTTPRVDGQSYGVVTDERGGFCFVYPRPAAGLSLTARFVGNNTFEGTEATAKPTPESEQRAETLLRFEPAPATIDLDKPSVTITASLRVDREDALRLLTGTTRREGLTLKLSDERGQVLAEQPTGGDGRVRFELKTKSFAGPGDGELTLEFAGDKQLGASKAKVYVTRVSNAQLTAPTEAKGDPEAGIGVDVEIATAFGPVDGGVVEATMSGESIGAAQVKEGKAHLVLTFAGGAAARVPVRIAYVPSSPFYRAGDASTVTVLTEGPSLLRQLALAGVVLALAGWIVAKWRRAPKTEQKDSLLPPPPSGRPEMLVLERPSGLRGWKGVVTDAHDAHPIAGAELQVVAPSLDGRMVLASVTTGEDGTFSIDATAPRDARLVVEGELHATYEQPLPPPSVLRIALITRRRALLDRLVRWARAKGNPFDSSREPTPGHVRRAAARAGVPKVEDWARKVEHAAFGPAEVTRGVELEIEDAEPHGKAPAQGAPDADGGAGRRPG